MSWNQCGDGQLAFTSMAITSDQHRQEDPDTVVSLPTVEVGKNGDRYSDCLNQHSLSQILGTRDQVTLQRLKAAMQVQQVADRERGISSVVDVQTLFGQVLWDPLWPGVVGLGQVCHRPRNRAGKPWLW